jgi:hypothetical protein
MATVTTNGRPPQSAPGRSCNGERRDLDPIRSGTGAMTTAARAKALRPAPPAAAYPQSTSVAEPKFSADDLSKSSVIPTGAKKR